MDSWVANRAGGTVHETATVTPCTQPAEVMKRFTIDVTEDLHKRIKAQCAMRGDKMADVIRDLLEREFPRCNRKTVFTEFSYYEIREIRRI